ncbi:MAG: hypothetical protein IT173_02755, partial [Acidobacteria bacterium]|nr:hypothetical protein [Acidobacteriota bacterium]
LRHAVNQDYEGFFNQEIRYRERMAYPPFVVLASLLIRHTDLKIAANAARSVRTQLDRSNSDKSCRILGPAPASIARLKNEHRIQILVKGTSRTRLREVIDLGLAEVDERIIRARMVQVEIDPVNML